MKTKILIILFLLFHINKEIKFTKTYHPPYPIEYNITKFFIDKGLDIHQSIAIAANLYVESKFDIEAEGDNGTSYGLAQWHKNRKEDLLNWINKNGNTVESQLEFLWWELNNKEKRALEKLKSTNDLATATKIFARYYERPYSKDYKERIEKSYELYNILKL
jgi:hypothetical protein